MPDWAEKLKASWIHVRLVSPPHCPPHHTVYTEPQDWSVHLLFWNRSLQGVQWVHLHTGHTGKSQQFYIMICVSKKKKSCLCLMWKPPQLSDSSGIRRKAQGVVTIVWFRSHLQLTSPNCLPTDFLARPEITGKLSRFEVCYPILRATQ